MTRRIIRHRVNPDEHSIQSQMFSELPYRLRPEIVVVAIPNGGLRHVRVALQLQDEGVRRGTPDIVAALHDGRCGWLEMKATRGGLRDEQIGFKTKVEALGHYWGLARSVDEALAHLHRWGALK